MYWGFTGWCPSPSCRMYKGKFSSLSSCQFGLHQSNMAVPMTFASSPHCSGWQLVTNRNAFHGPASSNWLMSHSRNIIQVATWMMSPGSQDKSYWLHMGDFLLDASDHYTKRQEAAPSSASLGLNPQLGLENVTPKVGGAMKEIICLASVRGEGKMKQLPKKRCKFRQYKRCP